MLRGIPLGVAWLLAVFPAWFEPEALERNCHCNCTCTVEISHVSWKWEVAKAIVFLVIGLLIGAFKLFARLAEAVLSLTRNRHQAIKDQTGEHQRTSEVALQAQGQLEILRRRRELRGQ